MAKKVGGVRIDIEANIVSLQKALDTTNKRLKDTQGKVSALSRSAKADFQSMGAEAKKIGNMITAGFAGVGGYAALNALGQMKAAFVDLVEAGDKFGDVAGAFDALGGKVSTINSASDAISGLIKQTDLYSQANKLMIAGVPGIEKNFAKITEIATKYASARGLDPTETLDKLSQGLIKLKPQILQAFGFDIKGKDKASIFAQVVAQLDEVRDRLGPLSIGVADTIVGITNAFQALKEEFGALVDSNPYLLSQLQALRREVSSSDFKSFAADVSAIASFAALAARSFLMLANAVNAIGNNPNLNLLLAGLMPGGSSALYLLKQLKDFSRATDKPTWDSGLIPIKETPTGDTFERELESSNANAAKKKLEEVRKSLYGDVASWSLGNVADKFTEAVDKGDWSKARAAIDDKLEALKAQLETKYKEIFESKNATLIDDATSFIGAQLRAEKDKLTKEIDDGKKKQARENEKLLRESYRNAVDYWSNIWGDALSGNVATLDEMLREVAANFGTQISASLTKSILAPFTDPSTGQQVAGSFEGLFSTFGQGLIAKVMGDEKGFADASGQFSAMSKKLDFAGAAFYAGSLVLTSAISGAMSMNTLNKQTGSEAGTGNLIGGIGGSLGGVVAGGMIGAEMGTILGAAGGPAGMIIGGMIGSQLGPILGQAVGGMFKHGPQNPETRARHAFAGWFEEQMQALGRVTLYDAQGKMKMTKGKDFNFLERRNVMSGDWAKEIEKYGDRANAAFKGLGEAFKGLAGITDEEGAKIGAMLEMELSGNLDNARRLVYELGYSFEDLKKYIDEAALAGNIRWAEYNAEIAGLKDAFTEGRAALGDLTGAFDAFVASGGRGRGAVKDLKDMIVEAGEKGFTTTQQIRDYLIAQGKSAEEVEAIISGIDKLMKDKGLKSLKDILGLDDVTLGSYVGQIEAASSTLAEAWQKMGATVDEVNQKLDTMANTDWRVKIKADIDPELMKVLDSQYVSNGGTVNVNTGATQKAASGGILGGPTFLRAGLLAGEAGPEAIAPLANVNGKLGISVAGVAGAGPAVHYHIDARGADAGVERRIRRALSSVKSAAVSEALNQFYRRR